MSRSFFAYHLAHFFGPFGLESYHTNSEKPVEGDVLYVVSGDHGQDGGKDYSLEGLFKIHRRHRGPFALRDLKGQERSFDYRLSLLPVRMPPKPIAMVEMLGMTAKRFTTIFRAGRTLTLCQRNTKGVSICCWSSLAVGLMPLQRICKHSRSAQIFRRRPERHWCRRA